jgi:hypothetical protein
MRLSRIVRKNIRNFRSYASRLRLRVFIKQSPRITARPILVPIGSGSNSRLVQYLLEFRSCFYAVASSQVQRSSSATSA